MAQTFLDALNRAIATFSEVSGDLPSTPPDPLADQLYCLKWVLEKMTSPFATIHSGDFLEQSWYNEMMRCIIQGESMYNWCMPTDFKFGPKIIKFIESAISAMTEEPAKVLHLQTTLLSLQRFRENETRLIMKAKGEERVRKAEAERAGKLERERMTKEKIELTREMISMMAKEDRPRTEIRDALKTAGLLLDVFWKSREFDNTYVKLEEKQRDAWNADNLRPCLPRYYVPTTREMRARMEKLGLIEVL